MGFSFLVILSEEYSLIEVLGYHNMFRVPLWGAIWNLKIKPGIKKAVFWVLYEWQELKIQRDKVVGLSLQAGGWLAKFEKQLLKSNRSKQLSIHMQTVMPIGKSPFFRGKVWFVVDFGCMLCSLECFTDHKRLFQLSVLQLYNLWVQILRH